MLTVCSLKAQEKTKLFGEITKEELEEVYFLEDSTVEAVFLYDYGRSYVDEIFHLHRERHVRIKIYKKSGLGWADKILSRIGYKYNTIYNLEIDGFTYNLENGKIKKDKINKYEDKIRLGKKAKYAAFPNVKVGTVIDLIYSYEVKNLGSYSWEFQDVIPKKWSEYIAIVPSYLEYKLIYEGYQKFDIEEEFREQNIRQLTGNRDYYNYIYRFVQKDVQALKETEFITTYRDHINRMVFQLNSYQFYDGLRNEVMDDWPKLKEYLLKKDVFGIYFKKNKKIGDLTQSIIQNCSNSKEKMIKIYNYVKDHFKWDGYYGIYSTQHIKETLKERLGGVSDINLLLTAMLREAEIQASPVILSTRDHGKIYKGSPFTDDFNYVIVQTEIDGNKFLLDATDPLRPFQVLPPEVFNGEGLLVDESSNVQWVELKSDRRYKQTYQLDINLDLQNQAISGSLTQKLSGLAALEERHIISEETEQEYKTTLKEQFPSIKIKNINIENEKDLSKDLLIKFDLNERIDMSTEQSGFYINPMLGLGIHKNPLKAPKRTLDLDFNYPKEENYIINFNIPAGYEVIDLPKNNKYVLSDKSAVFQLITNQIGNKTQIVSRFKMQKSIFTADKYLELRQLYDLIIEKHNLQVLIRKKTH